MGIEPEEVHSTRASARASSWSPSERSSSSQSRSSSWWSLARSGSSSHCSGPDAPPRGVPGARARRPL